jgi:hypothetical protein
VSAPPRLREDDGLMFAGLDSATPPTAAQLGQAKAAGVRMWSGYLSTKPNVNILHPWTKEDYARVKTAGLPSIAFCSGLDDPVACRNRAAEWDVKLCLDVESGIHGDGPWVQDWLTKSGAGLYGNAPVFPNRRAAFYVLAAFPAHAHDPQRTWTTDPHHPRPNGNCGWQWRGTHTEFGVGVDRGWYDDWFVSAQVDQNHWASMAGTFHHDPVVAQDRDGRLEVFMLDESGRLFDLGQSAANGGWWSAWADLGPPPPGGAAGKLAAGRNADGRLELFLRGNDGQIYTRTQHSAGGALSPTWTSLGGSFQHDTVVGQNRDGRLELFVVGDDGHLFELVQTGGNGSWPPSWADLGPGPPGGAGGDLGVGRNLDGRLQLFLRGSDGHIYTRAQQAAGGVLAPAWTSLGGAFQHDPVVARDLDGRLELFVLGENGHLFDLAQTAPNGSWWPTWADLGAPPLGGAAALGAGCNLDGRLQLFLLGNDGHMYSRTQQGAGGALTPTWTSLGGALAGRPVVGQNQDGRLEVFALGRDASVYHDWQVVPGGGWA